MPPSSPKGRARTTPGGDLELPRREISLSSPCRIPALAAAEPLKGAPDTTSFSAFLRGRGRPACNLRLRFPGSTSKPDAPLETRLEEGPSRNPGSQRHGGSLLGPAVLVSTVPTPRGS